jgi:hypothetical protein
MSVRRWLMVADCWQCGASIALVASAEAPRPAPAPLAAAVPLVPGPARVPPPAPVRRPRRIAPPAGTPVAPPLPLAIRPRDWAGWLWDAPAWLTSLLFHLLLLMALGLLTTPRVVPPRAIVLSTVLGPQHSPGGALQLPATDDQPTFDLPVPDQPGWEDPERRAELILADQTARELRMDPTSRDPHLPSLTSVRRAIQEEGPERMFATRDPRVRVELVRREGGTTLTEAAVARGLRWLARHQEPDGHWSLDRFDEHASCQGRCDGAASLESDAAATALALLPFLGAGQTHRTGIYRDVVQRGLRWMIERQAPDGDLRFDARGQAGMYAHGQAAIVLSEAYAMTRDAALRDPAQRAIDFIVAAQHRDGGWRYRPGERGDTSVLGWQLMALQSARVAGLDVPFSTLAGAAHYLDQVQSHDGSRYAYQPGHPPTCVMTAEALLCRIYLGSTPRQTPLARGLEWLVSRHPPDIHRPDIYYWYYATQCLHHAGGSSWEEWNQQLREILVLMQRDQGHEAGSWDPEGPHTHPGGRIYMTSLAVCTLEVYYRHAPIFRPLGSSSQWVRHGASNAIAARVK